MFVDECKAARSEGKPGEPGEPGTPSACSSMRACIGRINLPLCASTRTSSIGVRHCNSKSACKQNRNSAPRYAKPARQKRRVLQDALRGYVAVLPGALTLNMYCNPKLHSRSVRTDGCPTWNVMRKMFDRSGIAQNRKGYEPRKASSREDKLVRIQRLSPSTLFCILLALFGFRRDKERFVGRGFGDKD